MLGIDISHYTESGSWTGLKERGIGFVYVKASEGATLKDPLFDRHWEDLHKADVPCGAYHFAHPGSDPETQAAHFYSAVGALAAGDLQPALDLETGDGHPAAQVLDWSVAFVERAEALFGTRLIIYTGGFWRRTLGNPACSALGTRRLWTARYGTASPVLPQPWNAWAIWQFSDGINNVPSEARTLARHCDWNRLADGLTIEDLTVALNPLECKTPVAPVVPWPGRYLVFPSTPTMSGEDVRQWQTRMGERGWSLDPDGVYGSWCPLACISLQRQEGLATDGVVGPSTWQATFEQD
jgi:lysozyme